MLARFLQLWDELIAVISFYALGVDLHRWPKVRIHQDIVLNTSTLVDAQELVLVLPAQTRYESGGTSTSLSTLGIRFLSQ